MAYKSLIYFKHEAYKAAGSGLSKAANFIDNRVKNSMLYRTAPLGVANTWFISDFRHIC